MRNHQAFCVVLSALALVAACGDDTSSTGAGGVGQGAGTSDGGGAVGGSAGSGGSGGGGGASAVVLPTGDARFDYQLGGAYPPPAGVTMVVRDRTAAPADGLYNVCYVNGFQAQPDADAWWLSNHPTLVLRDDNGDPIIDTDWNEMLLDTSTPEKRAALSTIVGDWIAGCGADGYDAVEIDNLDSYIRSQGKLVEQNAVDFMLLLSTRAHAEGMAIAQKNSSSLVGRQDEIGTDFAVVEECNQFSECQDFVDGYGNMVFVIEYRQQAFDDGCANFPNLSILYRDLDLVPLGDNGYLFDDC